MPEIVDSYSESNWSQSANCNASAYIGEAQCFTGNGDKLSSVKFYCYKIGSPTGNVYAKLYAMTGTYGSTGTATGSVLATSSPVDIGSSNFPTTKNLVEFTFDGTYPLGNGVHYVVEIEYNGGDGSNTLAVGKDTTSPTHGGNNVQLYNTGIWYARAVNDLCFYIYGATSTIVLAGNISAVASSAGDLCGSVSIGGGISASSFLAALLSKSLSIAGNISAVAYSTGDLYGSVFIGGGISASSFLAAILSKSLSIAGIAAGSAIITGSMFQTLSINGVASGFATATGSMFQTLSIAGDISASSVLSGLFGFHLSLNGNMYGISYLLGEILITPLSWLEKLRWIAKRIDVGAQRRSAKNINVNAQRLSAKDIDVNTQRSSAKTIGIETQRNAAKNLDNYTNR